MEILESLTKRVLPARPAPPRAIVIHTTGETDLDEILRFYLGPDGLQPHYLIETIGTVRRIAPENRIAYHAKIQPAEARLYMMGFSTWSHWIWKNGQPEHIGHEFPGYFEWKQTWFNRGLASPLKLITANKPNAASIGIELQQPSNPTGDVFTDEQYNSLADLLVDVGARNRIVLDREHLLGHYDISPMRRSNARGNWDPGYAFRWNRLWDLLRKRAPIT